MQLQENAELLPLRPAHSVLLHSIFTFCIFALGLFTFGIFFRSICRIFTIGRFNFCNRTAFTACQHIQQLI